MLLAADGVFAAIIKVSPQDISTNPPAPPLLARPAPAYNPFTPFHPSIPLENTSTNALGDPPSLFGPSVTAESLTPNLDTNSPLLLGRPPRKYHPSIRLGNTSTNGTSEIIVVPSPPIVMEQHVDPGMPVYGDRSHDHMPVYGDMSNDPMPGTHR
jgi:hypothetical protein